jgi:hypothetical protein
LMSFQFRAAERRQEQRRQKNRPRLFACRGLEKAAVGSYSLSQKKRWGAVSFGSIDSSLWIHSPLLCSIPV